MRTILYWPDNTWEPETIFVNTREEAKRLEVSPMLDNDQLDFLVHAANTIGE